MLLLLSPSPPQHHQAINHTSDNINFVCRLDFYWAKVASNFGFGTIDCYCCFRCCCKYILSNLNFVEVTSIVLAASRDFYKATSNRQFSMVIYKPPSQPDSAPVPPSSHSLTHNHHFNLVVILTSADLQHWCAICLSAVAVDSWNILPLLWLQLQFLPLIVAHLPHLLLPIVAVKVKLLAPFLVKSHCPPTLTKLPDAAPLKASSSSCPTHHHQVLVGLDLASVRYHLVGLPCLGRHKLTHNHLSLVRETKGKRVGLTHTHTHTNKRKKFKKNRKKRKTVEEKNY